MSDRAKGMGRGTFLLFLFVMIVWPGDLSAVEKKLRVISESTRVYLQPDSSGTVIDTLGRGQVLSLLYSGKMKKSWYYVCFKSEKTGATKSGYVLDSDVELLFDPLRSVTIMEQSADLRTSYAPRTFEEMRWGLSKKEVVEQEGKPDDQRTVRGQDVMRYQQRVINLECAIDYYFSGNKLSRTLFSFAGDYLDKNAYLRNFQKVKGALVQKFGRPLEEVMNWSDTSYKDDYSSWGEAVSLGHVEMTSRWMTPQTEITARLSGADEQILLTVEYAARGSKAVASKSPE
jgi:hypothetical protein